MLYFVRSSAKKLLVHGDFSLPHAIVDFAPLGPIANYLPDFQLLHTQFNTYLQTTVLVVLEVFFCQRFIML